MAKANESSAAALLQAAAADIYHYGEAGARVDRIAAAAGLNKRMIYHYFGDKSELTDVVFNTALMQLSSASSNLSRATRQFVARLSVPTRIRHEIVADVHSDALDLHEPAVIVLRRMMDGAPSSFVLASQPASPHSDGRPKRVEWMQTCVELLSLAMPWAASATFVSAPGTSGFKTECERLLTPNKPRYRQRGSVRYEAPDLSDGTR